jgi:lipoyl-dependent peroxiredoxin
MDTPPAPERSQPLHPVVQPPTLTILYSSTAIATGGLLDGRVRTIDGQLDLALAKPRELGGIGDRPGHDSYQLLAAAYSASFLASLVGARSQDGPQFPPDAAVQATVAFGLRPDGGFGLEITLEVKLPGFEGAYAEQLMEKARHIWSIGDATREEALRLKLA